VRRRPLPDLLLDLDDDQRADVERQLGLVGLEPVAHRDAKPANVLPAAPKRDPYRSKAERDYAAWLDEPIHGPRFEWSYEPVRVALPAPRSYYTPDFLRTGREVFPGAVRIAIEVKGTVRETGEPLWLHGARRRALDGAAALMRELGLALFVAWRVDGVWQHERIPTRPA
jgi:hypothetical protein